MSRIEGKLTKIGHAVVAMHDTARFIIDGELVANYNLPEGSNAECVIRLYENAEMIVKGKFLLAYGSTVQVFGGGKLVLGNGFANSNTLIGVQKSLVIGDDFLGARNVTLYDSDHHVITQNGKQINGGRDGTIIGRHVWLGVNVTVLKGVTVGDGSVVGANAVVTRDVPPRCLAVGNPARVVKTGIGWRR